MPAVACSWMHAHHYWRVNMQLKITKLTAHPDNVNARYDCHPYTITWQEKEALWLFTSSPCAWSTSLSDSRGKYLDRRDMMVVEFWEVAKSLQIVGQVRCQTLDAANRKLAWGLFTDLHTHDIQMMFFWATFSSEHKMDPKDREMATLLKPSTSRPCTRMIGRIEPNWQLFCHIYPL
jgi:hypothetical protein